MVNYQISTGELTTAHGDFLGVGYSGQPGYKNDPTKCDQPNKGPIPPGRYTIGTPRDTDTHGPFVLPLTPHPENEMYKRSGFLMHGDSKERPGTASLGCIVAAKATREAVNQQIDRELQVIP